MLPARSHVYYHQAFAALLAQWQKEVRPLLLARGMSVNVYASEGGARVLKTHFDADHIFVIQAPVARESQGSVCAAWWWWALTFTRACARASPAATAPCPPSTAARQQDLDDL